MTRGVPSDGAVVLFVSTFMNRKAETMKRRKETQDVARRDLLRLAGLGSVAGVAAVATSGRKAEAAAETDGKSAGYRETEHVRTYYELAKF